MQDQARGRIEEICMISGEMFFSPQILHIIIRSNAVNAAMLCDFTARISVELAKIHQISPLKYVMSPLNKAVRIHISAVKFGDFFLVHRLR